MMQLKQQLQAEPLFMKICCNYCTAILFLCASLLNTVHAQQEVWNKSPRELFEMIGNPQVDLSDQGPAFENLKDKASYISGAQATNNIEAAYYLAECYVTGKTGDGGPNYSRNQKGFPPNRPESYTIAIPLYESAAAYDHLPSLVRLSEIYADGKYSGKDSDKSLTYLIRAAKLGDTNSLQNLLPLYSAGFPGVTDESQKFIGMKLLADNGNPEAQIGLAKSLISKNSKEASDEVKGLLIPLADKGNVSAVAVLKEIQDSEDAARVEAQKVAEAQTVQKELLEKQNAIVTGYAFQCQA